MEKFTLVADGFERAAVVAVFIYDKPAHKQGTPPRWQKAT
jgi:hypothetical protein